MVIVAKALAIQYVNAFFMHFNSKISFSLYKYVCNRFNAFVSREFHGFGRFQRESNHFI